MKLRDVVIELRIAVIATLTLSFIFCGFYPAGVWGLAQLLFPQQANGQLITREGNIIGSQLIGQQFTGMQYFHPRPSAAGPGYDAAHSGGSNLGPLSKQLIDAVQSRVAAYRSENNLAADAVVPADAATASGSGLDPHISVNNAFMQATRVARMRGLDIAKVQKLVQANTHGPDLFILGEPGVNVLALNIALDQMR